LKHILDINANRGK